MKNISVRKFNYLVSNIKGKKIAVIGDLMVDRYFWGIVSRISPEAPVPVVDIEREFSQLGGAANVGNNIKYLGGETFLIGVIGGDNTGSLLVELLESGRFDSSGIVIAAIGISGPSSRMTKKKFPGLCKIVSEVGENLSSAFGFSSV